MDDEEPVRRRTPHWLAALGAVLASTLAVVLVLSVPHLIKAQGTDGPSLPSPAPFTGAPDGPGTRTWQAMDCPPRAQGSCAAPLTLDHAGVVFRSIGGVRRAVASEGMTLTMRLSPAKGDRWVLVGAEHAGSGSSLALGIGRSEVVTIPPGTLSLFAAPNRGQVVVTLTERGNRRPGEVLRIQEYRQR